MRVSTNTMFLSGTYDMQSLQSQLLKVQMQMDNQKRIVTPSDDPVAAARVLQLSQSDSQNSQFVTNTKAAESWLSLSETAMTGAVNLLTDMKTRAIQAGNSQLAPDQLLSIQKAVQAGIQEMAGYGNATDGRGSYLFAGNKTSTAPFTVDASYQATYGGDTGQRGMQVSPSRELLISDPGSQVFGNASSATAAFDALKQFNDLMALNPKPANYAAQIGSVISNLDAAQKQLSQMTSAVGARRQENENVMNMGNDLGVQYKSAISGLQDLDLAQAVSDFTLTQTSLKYSQLTYTKVTGLSLFNFLG